MTDPKPIRRLEETSDGIRVVMKGNSNLYDFRSANVLCLEAVIEDHDRRREALTGLQEQLESERMRANQLHPREGVLTDVDPE